MMKELEILVEKVTGYCSCGYKEGDIFQCSDMNTPDTAFCGGAYMVLFPIQCALNSGSTFHFENNPKSKSSLACPDKGNVIFKIELVDNSC